MLCEIDIAALMLCPLGILDANKILVGILDAGSTRPRIGLLVWNAGFGRPRIGLLVWDVKPARPSITLLFEHSLDELLCRISGIRHTCIALEWPVGDGQRVAQVEPPRPLTVVRRYEIDRASQVRCEIDSASQMRGEINLASSMLQNGTHRI